MDDERSRKIKHKAGALWGSFGLPFIFIIVLAFFFNTVTNFCILEKSTKHAGIFILYSYSRNRYDLYNNDWEF